MATAQLTPTRVEIRNVLIATDFSRCSAAALNFGLQLIETYSGTAFIVSVVSNDAYLLAGPEAYVGARDAVLRDLECLKSELRRSHAQLADKNYRLYLLEGDIADSLLDFARKNEIDLIVMGTHGRGGVRKALLGSVAERVFRHSTVPVLTLGPGVRHPERGSHPRAIVAAADFTPASRRAVRYAAGLARQHGARLILLHVLDPAHLRHVPDRVAHEHGIEKRLLEMLGHEADALHCSVRIVAGRVTTGVLEVAKEEGADLLVLGVRVSSGVLDRLVIPHAYDIVRESPCPVLTLRETRSDDV
jgi:nucleotide-binding universal stress UspA family protein